eukprot:7050316-Alexandrium_andersonii.AAC.1
MRLGASADILDHLAVGETIGAIVRSFVAQSCWAQGLSQATGARDSWIGLCAFVPSNSCLLYTSPSPRD